MEQQLADTEAKLQDLQTNYTKVEHERDTATAELQERAKRDKKVKEPTMRTVIAVIDDMTTALIRSLDQVQHVLESTQALISCRHD
jgi:molecular chaperone GrpE (heat shock protein)